MRRMSRTRAFVAGVVILAMALSITALFGASGPGVRITSPAARAKVSGVITVYAEVTAEDRVSYALLVVDGQRPASTNSFPCRFEFDTWEVADGPHKLLVEAYDEGGLVAASRAVTIQVRNRPAAVTAVTRTAAPPASRVVVAPARPVPGETGSAARVATEPASDGAARVAGQTAVARGPLPEPARTAADATVAPRPAGLPAGTPSLGLVSGTRADAPDVLAPRPASYRGHVVMLNGRVVEFDVRPVMKAGRLHGGFRALFVNTGAWVTWHSETRTARSTSDKLTVEVPSGSRIARVNGAGVDMGSPASVVDGRTMIPVRFFADVTGAAVAWDSRTGIAHLRVAPVSVAERSQ